MYLAKETAHEIYSKLPIIQVIYKKQIRRKSLLPQKDSGILIQSSLAGFIHIPELNDR